MPVPGSPSPPFGLELGGKRVQPWGMMLIFLQFLFFPASSWFSLTSFQISAWRQQRASSGHEAAGASHSVTLFPSSMRPAAKVQNTCAQHAVQSML
eukprot:scaffold194355_cov21-Tisochrysis_lutea.AAC.1